jgi:hypothetical protein
MTATPSLSVACAENVWSQWDPEAQLVGALMHLKVDAAAAILVLVPDAANWAPDNRSAYEIIRHLVKAGAPTPTRRGVAHRRALHRHRYRVGGAPLCPRSPRRRLPPRRQGARMVQLAQSGAPERNSQLSSPRCAPSLPSCGGALKPPRAEQAPDVALTTTSPN